MVMASTLVFIFKTTAGRVNISIQKPVNTIERTQSIDTGIYIETTVGLKASGLSLCLASSVLEQVPKPGRLGPGQTSRPSRIGDIGDINDARLRI